MPATPVGDQPQAATNTNTLNAAAAHLAHNNGLKVAKSNVLKNQTGYNSPLFDGKDSQMEKGEYDERRILSWPEIRLLTGASGLICDG